MQSHLLPTLITATAAARDRYGDPLPERATQRLGTLRMRYPGGIGDLNYLPDGRAVIASGQNIEIWNTATGELQATHKVSESSVVSVEPRRDGQSLLLGDSAGSVLEWDLAQRKVVRTWKTGQARLTAAHYSPDEQRVLTTGSTPPTLKEWDLATGRELAAITGKMHAFLEGIYAPDGKTAFVDGSAGSGEVLAHYDLATGKLLHAWLKDYYTHGRSIVLSEDGQRLLVGSRHKATEWAIDGFKPLKEYSGHHGHAVVSVAYCRQSDELLTGSRDGSIRRWNRQEGKVLARWFAHQGHVTRIRVSPDGQWVLSYGTGTLAECSMADGSPRIAWERHDQPVQAVALLPDGRVVSGSGDGTVRLWDAATGRSPLTIPGANLGAYALAASADGQRIAAGCKDGIVREFAVADGKLLRERKGHLGYIRALVYTPNGDRLLSSADDGSVRVWSEASDEPVQILEGHRGGVLAVAVSADSRFALSGGRDGTVRHWDLGAGKELRVMEGHRGWVEAVAFAGPHALSGARDRRVLRWDLGTGKQAGEMTHAGRVRALAVTPDGRHVCAGGDDSTIGLWEIASGERLATFTGHLAAVNAVAVTGDGQRLVTASDDTTLLVWNLPRG